MNYTKYIKKKERLINEITEAFVKNVNLSNNFMIKNNFTEVYKDDVLSINLTITNYKLIFYVYIDFIKLDILKTKIEYFFYENSVNPSISSHNGYEDYENLKGENLNEKIYNLIESLSNLWTKK